MRHVTLTHCVGGPLDGKAPPVALACDLVIRRVGTDGTRDSYRTGFPLMFGVRGHGGLYFTDAAAGVFRWGTESGPPSDRTPLVDA